MSKCFLLNAMFSCYNFYIEVIGNTHQNITLDNYHNAQDILVSFSPLTSADPENLVRGGSTQLWQRFFPVDVGREGSIATKSG